MEWMNETVKPRGTAIVESGLRASSRMTSAGRGPIQGAIDAASASMAAAGHGFIRDSAPRLAMPAPGRKNRFETLDRIRSSYFPALP